MQHIPIHGDPTLVLLVVPYEYIVPWCYAACHPYLHGFAIIYLWLRILMVCFLGANGPPATPPLAWLPLRLIVGCLMTVFIGASGWLFCDVQKFALCAAHDRGPILGIFGTNTAYIHPSNVMGLICVHLFLLAG